MIRTKRRNQVTHTTENNTRPESEIKQEESIMKAKKVTILVNLKGEKSLENQRNNQVCSRTGNKNAKIESVGKNSLVQGQRKLIQDRLFGGKETSRRD